MCLFRRCSSPTAVAPRGPDLVGQAHMESPSGNTFNEIHDHPGAKQFGVKIVIKLIFMQELP